MNSTGAFTYSIPIVVPPGTAGMAPSLSLDYSSQSGDGLEGMGWVLSGLPSITRCPRTMATDGVHGSVNYDKYDKFCFEGQRLILNSGGTYGADGTTYRTEVDGFSEFIAHGQLTGGGPAWFEVHTKAGQIMQFGNGGNSQVLATGTSAARAWALNQVSDTTGNYLTVSYNSSASYCTYAAQTTNGLVCPSEIDYTGNSNGMAPYNSVKFFYESRPYSTPMFQAGSLQQNTVLLTDVKTYGPGLTHDYKISYNLPTNGAEAPTISQIQLYDSQGNPLNATSFGWQGSGNVITLSAPHDVSNLFQGTDNTTQIAAADFNGDGILDAVPYNDWGTNNCGLWLGSGNGTSFTNKSQIEFLTWQYNGETGWQKLPQPVCSGMTAPLTLDYDADGLADLSVIGYVDQNGDFGRYFLHNNGDGTFTEQSQTLPYDDSRFGDFNGDGRSDVFVNTNTAYVELSNGDGTWTASGSYSGNGSLIKSVVPPDFDGDGCSDVLYLNIHQINFFCNPAQTEISVSTNWGNSSYSIVLGDFNGDGKTDVLQYGNGGSSQPVLYLSTGTGFQSYNVGSSAWNKFSIYTGDFTGDGKSDLLLVADDLPNHNNLSTAHQLWISTGTGFVQAQNGQGGNVTITNTNNSKDAPENGLPGIRPAVADWNNDGAADIWLEQPSGDKSYLVSYVPQLMTSVSNGIGATTTVYYDRINKNGSFYSQTLAAGGYPVQNVDGPIYVVSTITSSNGVGGSYSSSYTYDTAQVDVSGRGFLGFHLVKVHDSQTGTDQYTYYNQKFPFTGTIWGQFKLNGSVTLSAIQNWYNCGPSDPNCTGYGGIYVVELTKTTVASADLDGTTMPGTETDYENYDAYGNPQTVAISTTPPGGSSPDVVKTTTNTYANYTTNSQWLLGRLTESDTTATFGSSTITRKTAYQYDPNTGLLTQEIVEPGASGTSNLKVTTTYGYDAYGNKNSVTVQGSGNPAPPPRVTATTWDTNLYHGQFPTTVTNALGESETWKYWTDFGTPKSHTGPNGITTAWTHDSFGRPSTETLPDGTVITHSYAYCANIGGTDRTCPNAQDQYGAFSDYVTTINSDGTTVVAPATRTYYDALSRVIAKDVQGFDGSWIRTDTIYGPWGTVSQQSRPYVIGQGALYTTFYRDNLGRVTEALAPDQSTVQTGYHGLVTTVTDQANNATTTTKNDLGLVASVLDAANNTTSYAYDAYGDLLATTDPLQNVVQNFYDTRGRKIETIDPDMGTWTYQYDSLGELLQQTDNKNQTSNMSYDELGRMVERIELDMTSTWTYGIGGALNSNQSQFPDSAGKLAQAQCTGSACESNGYTRTYYFDSLGRQDELAIDAGGSNFFTITSYEPGSSRIATVQYFSGYLIRYVYDSGTGYPDAGYLRQIVAPNSNNLVLWQADALDQELHLIQSESGNGAMQQTEVFDAETGRLTHTCASNDSQLPNCDGNLANLQYDWATTGQLSDRIDYLAGTGGLTEYFCYDQLYRVTDVGGYGDTNTCKNGNHTSIGYDAIGNIIQKSDAGGYNLQPSGPNSVRPHAVASVAVCSGCKVDGISGGNLISFIYDANGNLNCETTAAQCDASAINKLSWTSFNKPSSIVHEGATTISYSYDPEHNRIEMNAPGALTKYLSDPASGVLTEHMGPTVTPYVDRDYIMADGKMVAIIVTQNSNQTAIYYPILDHLGSVSVIVDGNQFLPGTQNPNANWGKAIDRYSYDAWGEARDPAQWTPRNCSDGPQPPFTRGFTGQEHIPSGVCLINFNARIYDPAIGRFFSADPTVEAPYNPQDLNRYSYVLNDPLVFTDPSGLCFLGCFWQQSWFGPVLDLALVFAGLPWLEEFSGMFTASGGLFAAFDATEGTALMVANAGLAGGISGYAATGKLG
ncbi:MAG: FG-GAP-like repeat-containing protein, partial [Rhizomicrobium sp.]